jgi:hypothetical protein
MNCGGRHPINDACEDVVRILPPENSPEVEAVLLKFQTRSGKVLRLGVSDTIVRGLGTPLLPLTAASGDR